ncbi:hypothetical protein V866_008047 [Kwoniella sp. B9012]
MPFKRLFGGRRRETSTSRGYDDDASDQWPPFQPIQNTYPSASRNSEHRNLAPGPAPGSWQSEVRSQPWNNGMKFTMYNPHARQSPNDQALDSNTYHAGGTFGMEGLQATMYRTQFSDDSTSSPQGGIGDSTDAPPYSPSSEHATVEYRPDLQAMLDQANANSYNPPTDLQSLNMGGALRTDRGGEMSWQEMQSTFRRYLQAREEVLPEIRPSWFRAVTPWWKAKDMDPEHCQDNPSLIDYALEESYCGSAYREACDRDARVQPHRSRAEQAWQSIDFGCTKPELDFDVIRGVLAFPEKISRYDVAVRSLRASREIKMRALRATAQQEYNTAVAGGEMSSAELNVLVKRFREVNGWWEENDDETEQVPGERLGMTS